jgi:TonB family protein
MMKNWEQLYRHQPIHLDAALLALALALHTPLLLIHMRAPDKRAGKMGSRLVDINYIEQQIQKRKEKPVALPPKLVEVQVTARMAEMKAKLLKNVPPPAIPQPKAKDQETIIKDAETIKLELKNRLAQGNQTLQSKEGFKGRDLTLKEVLNSKIKMAGGEGGGIGGLSGRPGLGAPGGAAALKGKSGFAIADNSVSSIGGGAGGGLRVGGDQTVVMPTASRSKMDASVLSPTVRDKGSLGGSGGGLTGVGGGAGGGISMGGAIGAGGGGIAIGSSRDQAGVPVGTSQGGGRTFVAKTKDPGSVGGTGIGIPGASLPVVPAIVRRSGPKKPMFQITGALANRAVLEKTIPEYPEWAREQGIEAAVTLQFTVNAEGLVKENILVARTSGYPAMDKLAIDALKKWKFVPLPPDQFQDEIGAMTMNFSVR